MQILPESPLSNESPKEQRFSSFGRRSSVQSNASGNKAKHLKNRASELIIQVPVRQLKKIARTEGIGSLQRETQHFKKFKILLGTFPLCRQCPQLFIRKNFEKINILNLRIKSCGHCITTINGLLRIYRSKGFFRFFWILVTIISFTLLLWQIAKLLIVYNSKPTVSQVSFLLPENGLKFPAITICNNPIRKEYVKNLNSSGHFSQNLLDYAMHSFMEPQYLLNKDENKLKLVDKEWKEFLKKFKTNFTINSFFWNASISCKQMLKYCSFGGRQFDCCLYAKGILTDIGKCYQLNFDESDQLWLKHQVQAGMNNGLQIIADAHTEEQINSNAFNSGHSLSEIFENGFHYYVHDPNAMPYLSTEGITVSPGTKVYSAISPTNYLLLSHNEWGNCSNEWPAYLNKIDVNGTKYFYERCGCSPFIYNIEEYFSVCTPYAIFKCLNIGKNKSKNMEKINKTEGENNNNNTNNDDDDDDDDEDNYFNKEELPKCSECKIECHRSVYHIYNSYSHGFSQSFLSWIQKKRAEWTPGHVHSNFVAINVFFRDMCYTEYKQIQSVGMTQILSDIGGNMGLFLGMSFISLIEFATFLWKIFWIFLSKKRREHMIAKKCRDEEREKHLQATMEFALQQRRFAASLGRLGAVVANNNNLYNFEQNGQEKVSPIANISLANPSIYSSLSSSSSSVEQISKRKPSVFNTLFGKRKITKNNENNLVINSIISNKLFGCSPSEDEEISDESKKGKLVELKINLNQQNNNNNKIRSKSTCINNTFKPYNNNLNKKRRRRRRVSTSSSTLFTSFPLQHKIN